MASEITGKGIVTHNNEKTTEKFLKKELLADCKPPQFTGAVGTVSAPGQLESLKRGDIVQLWQANQTSLRAETPPIKRISAQKDNEVVTQMQGRVSLVSSREKIELCQFLEKGEYFLYKTEDDQTRIFCKNSEGKEMEALYESSYHVRLLKLMDKEGWETLRSISIEDLQSRLPTTITKEQVKICEEMLQNGEYVFYRLAERGLMLLCKEWSVPDWVITYTNICDKTVDINRLSHEEGDGVYTKVSLEALMNRKKCIEFHQLLEKCEYFIYDAPEGKRLFCKDGQGNKRECACENDNFFEIVDSLRKGEEILRFVGSAELESRLPPYINEDDLKLYEKILQNGEAFYYRHVDKGVMLLRKEWKSSDRVATHQNISDSDQLQHEVNGEIYHKVTLDDLANRMKRLELCQLIQKGEYFIFALGNEKGLFYKDNQGNIKDISYETQDYENTLNQLKSNGKCLKKVKIEELESRLPPYLKEEDLQVCEDTLQLSEYILYRSLEGLMVLCKEWKNSKWVTSYFKLSDHGFDLDYLLNQQVRGVQTRVFLKDLYGRYHMANPKKNLLSTS